MAKILVNYTYNKSKDEYKILEGAEYVFADMAIAVMETEEEVKRPLVVPIKGMAVVVDRDTYESIHRKFKLVANDEGIITESENGAEVWLPKDTDLTKLRYINGQIVMVQEEPKQEQKEIKKPTKKKINKEA